MNLTHHMPFELWGGIECTINRVGDTFFQQLVHNGHLTRESDLDLFASLGIKALRYPVLWEQIAPHGLHEADWSWPDVRLGHLRELNITPIVGLLHHGSGPAYTNLLDPTFPEKLADYAAAVARRYPWVDHYTPINEPLTTARFSGLYGCWYPHAQEPGAFMRMLINECRATVLAMQAIRQVNPAAQLVQTEDMGKTYATPALAYQAEHENARRWLTFDLLCGRVDHQNPMRGFLRYVGIGEDELAWFLENPCPPDILGINYYLTSERFLDEQIEFYPADVIGNNGRHTYADVAAVRVRAEGLAGPYELLKEVWEQYHLPIAVTEIHNGCTREEQLRWFLEFWKAANTLTAEGVDLRALTVWALLGSHNWNTLLMRHEGYYEPGIFDVRGPQPRPTALAQMLTGLQAKSASHHPVLHAPGWWRRKQRLLYGIQVQTDSGKRGQVDPGPEPAPPGRPLLLVGAESMLGVALCQVCQERGIAYQVLPEANHLQQVTTVIDQHHPWAVINAVEYSYIDQAENEAELCFQMNVDHTQVLAGACKEAGIQFMTFSSDQVFDGRKRQPYVESDSIHPLSIYGRSKALAEQKVLATMDSALVIRTGAFFSPWSGVDFVTAALSRLGEDKWVVTANDVVISPTYLPDLVQTALDLLIDEAKGIWHVANNSTLSWAEFVRLAADIAGLNSRKVIDASWKKMGWSARRPPYSVLGSERSGLLPTIESALQHFVDVARWKINAG